VKQIFIFYTLVVLTLTACAVKPQPKFAVPAQKFVAPAEVTFTNTSMKADSYEWDFGDGTTSTEVSPKHRYGHSGNYAVVLTAKKGSKTVKSKQMIQVVAPEKCLVEIETEFGTMVAELYNSTPKHRDNFIKLAEEGFFNDLLFHRVINGFMIQGGDPQSKNAPAGKALGMGDPGYQIPAEFVDSLVHVKGALSAARTNNPEKKSSGSQFYIVQGNGPLNEDMLKQIDMGRAVHYTPEQKKAYTELGGTPHLDGGYTVFGRVINGLDIIDKIASSATDRNDRPVKDVKMKVRVIR
jgi:cyclophilin family peptidyl-prolyl cis-trans isomerase